MQIFQYELKNCDKHLPWRLITLEVWLKNIEKYSKTFLSLLVWTLLPICIRCGVLSLHPITLRQTTPVRTPLDKWAARRRELHLTTHSTHNRQISVPPAWFKHAVSPRKGRRRTTSTARQPKIYINYLNAAFLQYTDCLLKFNEEKIHVSEFQTPTTTINISCTYSTYCTWQMVCSA